MTRNLRLLTETEFDVLVIGAGIYGATIACDAAQRGLTVALIDRDDFGGGTSLNSLKIVHGGLRSLQRGNIADTRRFVRERRAFLWITVIGVRFTTARMTAEQTVNLVGSVLNRTLRTSRSATAPLPGGDIGDLEMFLNDARHATRAVDSDTLNRLARSYGTHYPRLLARIDADPGLAAPLGSSCGITRAEIVHAVREEMAVHLSDALLRRTEAGSAAHPGRDAVGAAASIVGREFGWDAARMAAEVDAIERRYHLA